MGVEWVWGVFFIYTRNGRDMVRGSVCFYWGFKGVRKWVTKWGVCDSILKELRFE